MFIYSDLKNKNVIVTGANGDIGIAICQKYLEQQCHVYALYHQNRNNLDKLKKESEYCQRLHILQCDINNDKSIHDFLDKLKAYANAIHILINNAGVIKDELFSAINISEFEYVIKTNLLGTCQFTKQLLLLLRSAEKATIINVASIAWIVPSIGQSNYSAAKAGIIGFTHTLAAELAGKGIRVNAVAPGMIESDMVKKVSRQVVRHIKSVIPLQRLGASAEVANTIVFLSSEASSYIVGQTLIVDGGMVMR